MFVSTGLAILLFIVFKYGVSQPTVENCYGSQDGSSCSSVWAMERLATKILQDRKDAVNFSASVETIHDHLRNLDKRIENISAVFHALVSDHKREIQLLKNENQELKAIQNHLEESLMNLTDAVMKLEETAQEPTSCLGWKQKGYRKSTNYTIGPEGPVPRFNAFCDMSSDPPMTVFHHNKEDRTLVKGYEAPGSFQVNISYEVPMDEFGTIIDQFSNCKQYLKWECLHSVLTSYAWWVSRTGGKMSYWGGGPVNGRGCACAVNNSCLPGLVCNCEKNDLVWREDGGYLTDKSTLPVSQLYFGDTGDPGEEGYYTLGPLECM